jgi:hypothetical protein
MASSIEAMFQGCLAAISGGYMSVYVAFPEVRTVAHSVRKILEADRVSWAVTEKFQMEPFSSQEMYVEVVQPTLVLLASKPGWEGVERAYQDALGEIHDDPADAITDAGTALQEALIALGLDGKNLGRLLADARKKGLLGGHDSKLSGAIETAVEWASANRSERGESHTVSDADAADAWLMVHVVGALILRLSKSE